MFTVFFCFFIFALLALDKFFLPKSASKAWNAMVMVFGFAGLAAAFQSELEPFRRLLGVGRTVDVFIYLTTIVLVRELFLIRARNSAQAELMTQLVRKLAIEDGVNQLPTDSLASIPKIS
jgi:hypothetical protein